MSQVPPLRILQLTAPDAVGGLERVVQALAIGLHARGHDVRVAAVISPRDPVDPFFDPLHQAGVPAERIVVSNRGYLAEHRAVGRLLRGWRPQAAHTHGYRSDVLHVGQLSRAGAATVTTLHGSSRMGGLSTVSEWIQLAVLRRFDGVVAVSRPLGDELRGRWVPEARLHVIPNGWTGADPTLSRDEARATLGIAPGARVVGWVGRLIEVKKCDLFLEALARLQPLPMTVAIVGDGWMRPALEARVAALGLQDRVRFHGAIFDIARAFRAFDVFVLSSRSEGTPVVLFEAMAAALPIVATRVGGIPDMIGEGEGLLVPSGDAGAMAAAIRSMLDDPAAAATRGAAAHARLHSTFGADQWLAAHEQLYARLAAARTAR